MEDSHNQPILAIDNHSQPVGVFSQGWPVFQENLPDKNWRDIKHWYLTNWRWKKWKAWLKLSWSFLVKITKWLKIAWLSWVIHWICILYSIGNVHTIYNIRSRHWALNISIHGKLSRRARKSKDWNCREIWRSSFLKQQERSQDFREKIARQIPWKIFIGNI